MSSSMYDTHAGVKHLTEAGMPKPQAEAVIQETAQSLADRLVSREEFLNELRLLREEARTREYRMVVEILAGMAALLGVFAAIVRLA